jgi:signal peptidase I
MSDPARTDQPAPAATRSPEKAEKQNSFLETIRFLLTVAILAVALRSFLFAPFNIPSESMLPRLLVGDYLFVSKWPYGYSRYSFPFGIVPISGRIPEGEPARGDIVVFKYPGDNKEDYIKRVIGLPGDIIQMKQGQIFINGGAVPKVRIADFVERASPNTDCRGQIGAPEFRFTRPDGTVECRYPQYRETLPNGISYNVLDEVQGGPGDDTDVYVVPEGHYFMMGDNRDDSADSRFPLVPINRGGGVGFVPSENIVGKAVIMFFSTDGSAEWLKPWTWFTAVRWERIGHRF